MSSYSVGGRQPATHEVVEVTYVTHWYWRKPRPRYQSKYTGSEADCQRAASAFASLVTSSSERHSYVVRPITTPAYP